MGYIVWWYKGLSPLSSAIEVGMSTLGPVNKQNHRSRMSPLMCKCTLIIANPWPLGCPCHQLNIPSFYLSYEWAGNPSRESCEYWYHSAELDYHDESFHHVDVVVTGCTRRDAADTQLRWCPKIILTLKHVYDSGHLCEIPGTCFSLSRVHTKLNRYNETG